MKISSDPTFHRDCEKQFIDHARGLLDDARLRLDTNRGVKPITTLMPSITEGEPGVERGEKVKRLMLELGVTDRQLQSKMPVGERIEVNLRQRNFWMFKKTVGQFIVASLSPTKSLLIGQTPAPVSAAEVNALLAQFKQSSGAPDVPATVALMSTSGFTPEAKEIVSQTDGRTLVLAEPNEAGGWNLTAPSDSKDLSDLLDPEQAESKRHRVREYLDENKFDLLSGGIVSEKIASRTQLPLQIIEAELRSYAKENPGLAAKRIEGKLMLFREGSALSIDPGGLNMPFWETVKGIFKREESTDRKISRLAAERAGLTAQRERAYDEIASVEKKESELTKGFKEATALAQRRIATEISQLRKDIERRQQILGAIDKKMNVINTGIHTLELQNQVSPEKLKTLENIAASSEEVDVGMAALQQLDEEANSMSGVGAMDVPDDVQAILDELKGKEETPAVSMPGNAQRNVTAEKSPERSRESAAPLPPERRRNEPEPG